jgi:hypothetical protein
MLSCSPGTSLGGARSSSEGASERDTRWGRRGPCVSPPLLRSRRGCAVMVGVLLCVCVAQNASPVANVADQE